MHCDLCVRSTLQRHICGEINERHCQLYEVVKNLFGKYILEITVLSTPYHSIY
jgi:hypothetical protein